MTEPERTGYQDSPDTTDPAGETTKDAGEAGPTLTTDDDAQTDDGVVRPGNEPD